MTTSDLPAANTFSFDYSPNKLVVLTGEANSGKTTTGIQLVCAARKVGLTAMRFGVEANDYALCDLLGVDYRKVICDGPLLATENRYNVIVYEGFYDGMGALLARAKFLRVLADKGPMVVMILGMNKGGYLAAPRSIDHVANKVVQCPRNVPGTVNVVMNVPADLG